MERTKRNLKKAVGIVIVLAIIATIGMAVMFSYHYRETSELTEMESMVYVDDIAAEETTVWHNITGFCGNSSFVWEHTINLSQYAQANFEVNFTILDDEENGIDMLISTTNDSEAPVTSLVLAPGIEDIFYVHIIVDAYAPVADYTCSVTIEKA